MDQLNTFLSNLMLAFIQEMEGKPSHQIKRCYDRDTDLVNSHWTLANCMFAVMNQIFSIGPLSFYSFFVEEVGDENAFLYAQAKQEGCAIAKLNAASGIIKVLQSTANNKYLGDGECTGTLNLYGFDLLGCCYANVGNCLYTCKALCY
uniref:Uncharacterized protein n=1 Tax=Panagrolaimus sp. PS1159 TaxID=55785 RepID=A0AC35GM72_9BILA